MTSEEISWPAPWKPISSEELGIIDGLIPADKEHNLEIASYGATINEELAGRLGKDPSNSTNEDFHAWYLFENTETQQHAYIRVNSNTGEETPKVSVTSIIFPTNLNRTIKTSSLSSFPLTEIESSLNNIYFSNLIAKRRTLYLTQSHSTPIDYSEPLPRNIEHDAIFYALVAEQFNTIEQKYNSVNPAKIQSEINEISESTIRSWLSTARKLGLLMPTTKGRKKSKK